MSEQTPMVSVIVPTCNRARLIGRALASIARQGWRDYEVIVVDDCSDDGTAAAVAACPELRPHYARHQQRRGGAAARNTGLSLARGELVAFLDDDDEWLPEKLQRQVEVFRQAPDLGLVYTGYLYVDAATGTVRNIFEPRERGRIYRELLLDNCVGTTSSAMLRRDCLTAVGGFDERLPACQDWDLWLRVARCFRVDYIREPLLRFYQHEARITRDVAAKIAGRRQLLEKYRADIEADRRAFGRHCFTLGYLLCHAGQTARGRAEIARAIRLDAGQVRFYRYYLLSLLGPTLYTRLLEFKATLRRQWA